jgi:hypothetical protein
MAPEFGVGTANSSLQTCLRKFQTVMAFPPLLMLGLHRPGLVATALFALPRSHHEEVRLTVGGIKSSLDPHLSGYCGLFPVLGGINSH